MPGAGEHGGVLPERDRELERIGRCLERAKAGSELSQREAVAALRATVEPA